MPIPIGVLAQAGAGAGVTPGFELLETTLITSDTASVTFSNLNNYSNYKHLQIRMVTQLTTSGSGSTVYTLLRFNGDSANNYFHHWIQVDNGSNTTGGRSSSTANAIYAGTNTCIFGTQNNNMYAAGFIDIFDFGVSTKYKTIKAMSMADQNSDDEGDFFGGTWMNTAAITSISLIPASLSFRTGSRVSLYGIG